MKLLLLCQNYNRSKTSIVPLEAIFTGSSCYIRILASLWMRKLF